MTAKEYLSQAYRLDQRINSKLEQVEALRSLTRKMTTTYEGEQVARTRSVTSLEDTIVRMMEAEDDLNSTIDALVDLKMDISRCISDVENHDYQVLLEKHYLCFQPWAQIATEMHYSSRWVHAIHSRALNAIDKVLREKGALDPK